MLRQEEGTLINGIRKRYLWKSVVRVLLLAAAVYFYFSDREKINFLAVFEKGFGGVFLWIVWIMLALEMLFRIFPNKLIALGSRKHFACSYRAAGSVETDNMVVVPKPEDKHKGAFSSALFWFAISALIIFALFLLGAFTPGAVILLTLVYAVADLFFIMVFCPLRVLFMRNHCCVTCRIYNWDYFMICTPMIVFPCFYSLSLFVLSVLVILRWELSLRKNPHFFSRETNDNLRCESCTDRLCPKW